MSGRSVGIGGAAWTVVLRRIGGFLFAAAAAVTAVLLLWKPCLPFAAAYLLAGALQRPYCRLRRCLRGHARAAAVLLVLGCAVGGGALLWCLGLLLWEELCRMVVRLGEQAPVLIGALGRLTDGIASLFSDLPFGGTYGGALFAAAASSLSDALPEMLGAALAAVSAKASSAVSAVLSAFPGIMLFLVVFVLSAIRLTQDHDAAAAYLAHHLPPGVRKIRTALGGRLGKTVGRVVRAYAVLSALTFVQLLLGLALLGVKRAFSAALIGTLIDVLPVFGVGVLLLPWALLSFLCGRARFGAGLVVLYLVISILRQIMEPRLIGRSMGLHPLAALFALYSGGVLFGMPGLVLAPFVLTLIVGGYRMIQGRDA